MINTRRNSCPAVFFDPIPMPDWIPRASASIPSITKVSSGNKMPESKIGIETDFKLQLELINGEKSMIAEMIRSLSDIFEASRDLETMVKVEDFFQNGDDKFILARSIPYSVVKTNIPARCETKIITNRAESPCLFTPSTFIVKSAKVLTASRSFGKWFGGASALYCVQPFNYFSKELTRCFFPFSYKNASSNRGFSKAIKGIIKKQDHSHAQVLDVFIKQKRFKGVFERLTPKQISNKLESSANEIYALDIRSDCTLPHNEVLSKVWPWDICAIDSGVNKNETLTTLFETILLKRTLLKEVEVLGSAHPLIQEFIAHSLSIDKDGCSRNLRALCITIKSIDKRALVDKIKEQLKENVIVCKYNASKQRIKQVEYSKIEFRDAFDGFLSSRGISVLQHLI